MSRYLFRLNKLVKSNLSRFFIVRRVCIGQVRKIAIFVVFYVIYSKSIGKKEK